MKKKVTVAKKKLKSLNPFIAIIDHDIYLSSENVEKLICGKDLIVDCTDNLHTKYLLHDACFRQRVPLISASIYQFEGQVRTFVPGNEYGCMRCLQSKTPEDDSLGNCNDFGVIGSAVSTIGSILANEAILFLNSEFNNTIENTFYFDVKHLSQFKIKNIKKEFCSFCEGKEELQKSELEITRQEISLIDSILVDVRNQPDEILNQYLNSEKNVIAYCDRGIRSKRLVEEMHKMGHKKFYSLKGGACLLSH